MQKMAYAEQYALNKLYDCKQKQVESIQVMSKNLLTCKKNLIKKTKEICFLKNHFYRIQSINQRDIYLSD